MKLKDNPDLINTPKRLWWLIEKVSPLDMRIDYKPSELRFMRNYEVGEEVCRYTQVLCEFPNINNEETFKLILAPRKQIVERRCGNSYLPKNVKNGEDTILSWSEVTPGLIKSIANQLPSDMDSSVFDLVDILGKDKDSLSIKPSFDISLDGIVCSTGEVPMLSVGDEKVDKLEIAVNSTYGITITVNGELVYSGIDLDTIKTWEAKADLLDDLAKELDSISEAISLVSDKVNCGRVGIFETHN